MKLGGRGENIGGNSLTNRNCIFLFILFFCNNILRVFSFWWVSQRVCVFMYNFYFLKAGVDLSMMISQQCSPGHSMKVVFCNILFLKEKSVVLYTLCLSTWKLRNADSVVLCSVSPLTGLSTGLHHY